MKHLLPFTLLTALFGGVAYANTHGPKQDNPCMKSGKVLTQSVELTADQQALVADLKTQRQEHKANRQAMRQKMMQERFDTVKGYTEGSLSREEVNQQIVDKHQQMSEHHGDMQDSLLALIDSYSPEQRAQVQANLDETLECRAEYQAQFADKGEKMEQRFEKRSAKKAEILLQELNLSADQAALFEAWQEGQQGRMQHRMERHQKRDGHHLEALLEGNVDQRQLQQKSAEHLTTMQEQAGLMMDFVDALDAEQRTQFIENLEVLQEKMEQRMEKSGHRKGKGGHHQGERGPRR